MIAGKGHLKPICVIYGKSAFLRREALDRIVARELAGGDPSINVRRVDGAVAEASDVLDDVRTFSLLGDRRVVVVDDADTFVRAYRVALERFAAAPAASGCLILVCSTFDGRTRLFRAIDRIGEVVQCKPMRGAQLTAWVSAYARQSCGKRLDRGAAARLCEHAGTSEESLSQEICKLAAYVGGREEITARDVDAVVGSYREQKVFAVIDAVAEGDARSALTEWRQVLATDPAASGRAIGGLAWAIRRLIDARQQFDRGASIAGLARELWTNAASLERRMQRCSVARLEDQLCDLLSADVKIKTGLGNVASAVDNFIVKHSVMAR